MAPRFDRRIAQVVEVMEQQLSESLPVARLASVVNLSPSRFAHLFRQTTGMAPGRYLYALRLRRAAALLAATSLPVSEVMQAVGWNDPSHFSKAFRRRFGVSPRHYRDHGARWVTADGNTRSDAAPSHAAQQNAPSSGEPLWPTYLPGSVDINGGDDSNE